MEKTYPPMRPRKAGLRKRRAGASCEWQMSWYCAKGVYPSLAARPSIWQSGGSVRFLL